MDNYTEVVRRFFKLYPTEQWKNRGFFTDDYVDVINSHWLQFDPPHAANFYFLAVLYTFIMTIGISGNAIVIFLYFRNKELKTTGNMLIVNLAISDFILMSKIPIFIYNSFNKGPALGDIACRYYGFIGGLTGTVSICTLASIAIDRFYVIKYPLNRAMSGLRVKINIFVIWFYSLIFAIIPLLDFGWGSYTPEGYLTSCSYDYLTPSKDARIFIFIFFVAAWVLPLVIIAYCYSNILMVVMQRGSTTKKERESFRHIREEDKRKQEVKLSLICLGVIFLWFAAWTPYSVVSLLGITNNKNLISPIASMIPALFCKISAALDPYVYALSHPKFKKELCAIFGIGEKSQKPNKVFSMSKPPKRNFDEANDEVSEVETVEVPSHLQRKLGMDLPRAMATNDDEMMKNKKSMSVTELICFRPNFSNRSSSIRKIARKMSVKN